MKDYYKILNINYNMSTDNITVIYNNKLNEYKKNPFLSSSDKKNIKELREAYFVLSDPKNRSIYDTYIKKINSEKQNNTNEFSTMNRFLESHNPNYESFDNAQFSNDNINNNQLNINIVDASEILRPKYSFVEKYNNKNKQSFNFDT